MVIYGLLKVVILILDTISTILGGFIPDFPAFIQDRFLQLILF